MATVKWTGVDSVKARMEAYKVKVRFGALMVARYWQAELETYAKENAPWIDRTANARQTLHAFVEETSVDTVTLYLSHGVDYGLYLEVRWGGKYAIIWPTIEAHLGQIAEMLRGLFG